MGKRASEGKASGKAKTPTQPSGKAAAALKAKAAQEDTQQREVLQALVVAELFPSAGREHAWGPIISQAQEDDFGSDGETEQAIASTSQGERPFCLLPFLNRPLLAWSLESLSSSGFEKATVLVNSEHHDAVLAWLRTTSYYERSTSQAQDESDDADLTTTFAGEAGGMVVILQKTQNATTLGELMREVDGAVTLESDFLLLNVGYIGNIHLGHVLQEFSKKRRSNPSLVMESVVSDACLTRPKDATLYAVSDQGLVLHYDSQPLYPINRRLQFPAHLMSADPAGIDLRIRTDLEWTGIELCTAEVPPLYTENFDYATRADFINGIITSDILGKQIGCLVVDDASQAPMNDPAPILHAGQARIRQSAIRIEDTHSYDVASRAMLARCFYPSCPDEIYPLQRLSEAGDRYEEQYELRRSNVYLSREGHQLARTAQIGPIALIGPECLLESSSIVSQSVLGRRCRIGAESSVQGSYLFDGCQIAEGCVIRDSILGVGCVVLAGSIIEHGSLIGPGSVIGRKARLTGHRIAAQRWAEFDLNPTSDDIDLLGKGATAFIWPSEEVIQQVSAEEEEDEDLLDVRNLRISKLGVQDIDDLDCDSSASSLSRSSSSDSLDALSVTSNAADGPRIGNIASLDPTAAAQSAFASECTQTLQRAYAENLKPSDTALELTTLRMASNVTLGRVRQVAVPFICSQSTPPASVSTSAAIRQHLTLYFDRWSQVVTSITGPQTEEQVDTLLLLQKFCIESVQHARYFSVLLQIFYDDDIVTEAAIGRWTEGARFASVGGEAGDRTRQIGQAYAAALAEAEEETDSKQVTDARRSSTRLRTALARWASGGGISDIFHRPSHQASEVAAYLSGPGVQVPSSIRFNHTNLGYPDVSGQGTGSATWALGGAYTFGGTSSAVPTLAGLIALLNDALEAEGRPSMGFLNPWQYHHANVCRDMKVGKSYGCGKDGNAASLDAVPGFDLASGLGTVDFPALLAEGLKTGPRKA
ncbi:hypothetical protein E5Q_03542 [Mixia osmundae IAM 14324]|uniref:Translation initiation factor eIF2B subunit epsilon n=1 Tax=Mixia osmundae (strain CBS 9802 / IAM 14324 / JCM 22182 / KY 12970) TaxID=764103 RepID=G7E232_MIXOS|nr:hypothetical protein E5Q_03542 [Mixia osmundae IAM 14324]